MPIGWTNLVIAVFPLALLIYLMARRKAMAAHKALPIAAALLYLLQLFYFRLEWREVHAAVVNGLLTAWTPILVIGGAVFLFTVMEHTGSLDVIRRWLNGVTESRVGQLMIIGWAFAFLIEGASGFGTPAALAAPLLMGLGFPPVRVAIMTLIMNSVPVSFGAVGTPTWFGLGQLGLSPEAILEIGFKTALIHAAAALIIPVLALRMLVPWGEVRKNWLYIYLSILACVAPYLLLARYNVEFPALIGGAIGLVVSIWLAQRGVGIDKATPQVRAKVPPKELLRAFFPILGVIFLLIVTRVPELGLKGLLNAATPGWEISLGGLGIFSVSAALVLGLKNILGTASAWTHAVLYVPSVIPFLVVGLLSFALFKDKKGVVRETWRHTLRRMWHPTLALSAALVFVKLIMAGGDRAITTMLGTALAQTAGVYWPYFASYLGALGSFFAGSNTVSNLTFGGIQLTVARQLGLNETTVLALQSAGGAMGNMVCINNIVAVCSVLGLERKEGEILKKTFPVMLIYGLVAALMFGLAG